MLWRTLTLTLAFVLALALTPTAQAQQVLSGQTGGKPPTSSTGSEGQFFQDLNSGSVFYKTSGQWTQIGNSTAAIANSNPSAPDRAPTAADDSTRGYAIGDMWCALRKCWQTNNTTVANASWLPVTMPTTDEIGSIRPLEITGLTAAWAGGSILLTSADSIITLNKSIDIWRSSDMTIKTIGWRNNVIDAAMADGFCGPSWAISGWCDVVKIYDQSYDITTGAAHSNDAIQLGGWNVTAAVVAAGGGGVGCTAGLQTFTLTGGTFSAAATISGTVTTGVLSGALTIPIPGSYQTQASNPAASTGGGCTTPPTFTLTWGHAAPGWTANTVNGLRVINFSAEFMAGNPQSNFASVEYMNIPSVSVTPSTVTLAATLQVRSPFNRPNCLWAIGLAASNRVLCPSFAAQPAGFSAGGAQNPAVVARTNPQVLTATYSTTGAAITQNNLPGSLPVAVTATTQTAAIIGGGVSSRPADFDLSAIVEFGVNLSATTLTNLKASLAIATNTTTQTKPNQLLVVGDSITYSLTSPNGNSWPKYMQMLNLLTNKLEVINLGYPGAKYAAGGLFDYTAQFSTVFTPIYSATSPNVIIPVLLGTNDTGTGADGPTTYARAQTFFGLAQALGTNVKTIATTLIPRDTVCIASCQTAMLAYNTLVRTNWNSSIANGGLGASGLCDFANDPLWTQANVLTNYTDGGTHPTDPGSLDMAITCAAIIAPLLK